MYEYFGVAYYLSNLLQHSRWSRDRLLKHQNKNIHKIVDYAYRHVSFYHEKFKEYGINPDDVRTQEDLSKLPIIRRRELQENANSIISDEFDVRRLAKVSTSGSTGQPLFTYITRREDAFRKAKLLRANTICGQRPRDRWVIITGPQHQAQALRLQKFLGVYAPIPVSVFDNLASQISKIENLRPDVLDGYSNSLLLLAKEVEKKGDTQIKPKMIIGGAELIDASSRRFIENHFDAPFYDEYALVELERLAWQCEERAEYHIDADSVIMEFVDSNDEKVGPGETGEIVCTSLFNYAMPFIRYAVGDLGKPSQEERCCCGRAFPLMKVIEGRKDSLVFLPDGRVVPPLAIGWAMEFFKFYSSIYQYRVIQKRIDSFRVLIKKKDNGVDKKTMEVELENHLKKMLNLCHDDVRFEIEFVPEIPLEKTGKLRKVISEL